VPGRKPSPRRRGEGLGEGFKPQIKRKRIGQTYGLEALNVIAQGKRSAALG